MGNRNTKTGTKLNQRLLSAPLGAVLTSAWLQRQGISADLSKYYVRAGWLQRVGNGAFTIQNETPENFSILASTRSRPSTRNMPVMPGPTFVPDTAACVA